MQRYFFCLKTLFYLAGKMRLYVRVVRPEFCFGYGLVTDLDKFEKSFMLYSGLLQSLPVNNYGFPAPIIVLTLLK